jgi:hypothetical protein
MGGRRIINAGDGIDQTDYVTKRQLVAASIGSAVANAVDAIRSLVVSGIARFLSTVFVTTIDDACVVFTKAGGELAGDNVKLSWRYTNDALRLGASVNLRWHHGAELRSATAGVLELSGEDHDVSNNFIRIAFGLDDTSHPALQRNGTGLEIRRAGGGVLTDLGAKAITADNFIATGRQLYNETIGGTRRTFDSTTVTLSQLAEVVGTMIEDLDAIGLMDT